ncbi:MAG: arylsulfotransferase family protein [Thermoanaerobaculia bacterium]
MALLCAFALGVVAGHRWPAANGAGTPGSPPDGRRPGGVDGAPAASDDRSAAPARGKWREARMPGPSGAEGEGRSGTGGGEPAAEVPDQAAEALLAAPYLQGYRPAGPPSPTVTVHDDEAVAPGLNLYVSGHGPEAILMDPLGRVLHTWRTSLRAARPDLYAGGPPDEQVRKAEYFRRARLLSDGSLLAIFEGLALVKLDRASNLLWAYRGGAHHDLDVDSEGRVYVLDREGKELPRLGRDHPVLEDFVTVLSPEGERLQRISILEAFEGSPYAPLLHRIPRRPDVFHTNTVEILDGSLARRNPAFREGNLLISVLELDTVAVLDPERGEIVWALTGLWRKQHQPTVVPPGRLLLFDNLGAGLGRSRAVELDPFTQEVAWTYGGDRATDLYSKTLGSCQRLPNGNTLLTESENGRALEVTRAGEPVWEFRSPHRAGDEGELVAVLPDLVRLPPDFPFQGVPERAARAAP